MAQTTTYTSDATGLLFHAKIKSAEINGKTYSVNSVTRFRSDARPTGENGDSKHSNMLFAIRDLFTGKLKAGYVDKNGPYLLETEKYRALVTIRYQNDSVEKIVVATTADEAHSPQAYANFLMAYAFVVPDAFPNAISDAQSSTITENESALCMFEDSFYYDLKYYKVFIGSDHKPVPVEVSLYDDTSFIDAGFAKIDGCNPINVPEKMEYLTNSSKVLPFFKDLPAGDSKSASVVDKIADLYSKVKAGAFRKFDYRFPPSAQEFIPSLDYLEGYVPSKDFFNFLELAYIQQCESFGEPYADIVPTMKALASEMNPGNVLNVLLYGPPGTGKSTMPRAVAAALGIPFRNVTCSPEADENTYNLQIMFGENGEMKYFEQPFRVAYREGGIIVCDEVNLSRPDVLQGVFSAALDDSYRIGNMRTDKDTVEGRGYANRAASTVCCFTCNPGVAGTKLQNTAFYSRIATWFELSEIKKENLFSMVRSSYKTVPTEILESIYGVYYDLRESLSKQMDEMKEYEDLLSPRCFRYCVGQYMNGIVLSEAIKSTMIRPLVCLVQEKGEDTFKEFETKIKSKIETRLTNAAFAKKRHLALLDPA